MTDTAMARFLDAMEQRAQRDVREHLLLQRVGVPAVMAFGSAFLYYSFAAGEHYTATFGGAALAIMGAAALGGWVGDWFARRSEAALPRLQAQVRERLLDGGLLQLVLEPDPYDRLPSLQPLGPMLLGRRVQPGTADPLQARLERFVRTFEDCSAEAGLTAATPAVPAHAADKQSLPGPKRRVLFLAGAGLIAAATMVSSNELFPTWFNGVLYFAFAACGYGLFAQSARHSKQSTSDPLGQSALQTAAVRLELAELLRSRGVTDGPPVLPG